jgi:hypothetical protein
VVLELAISGVKEKLAKRKSPIFVRGKEKGEPPWCLGVLRGNPHLSNGD